MQGCDEWLDDQGHHRAACTCRLRGHNLALHDQFQAGLHRILRDLPVRVTSTTDKGDIPTHASVDTGLAGAQREQGDIYLKVRNTATSPASSATASSSSMSPGSTHTPRPVHRLGAGHESGGRR